MPDNAAPSRRSPRNTIANAQTAVRLVTQAKAMNTPTYAMPPAAAARNAGHAFSGTPATIALSALAGATEHSTTAAPPSHRPSTICHAGAGDSHVKCERSGPHLGAEDRVTDDQRGDRHQQAEDRLGGNVGERPAGGVVDRARQQSEQDHAETRQGHRGEALGGRHERNVKPRIAMNRDRGRADTVVAVIAPTPGTGSRVSRRARGPRTGGRSTPARRVRSRWPARVPGSSAARARRAGGRT